MIFFNRLGLFRIFVILGLITGFQSLTYAADSKVLILITQQNRIYRLIDDGVEKNINAEFTEIALKDGEKEAHKTIDEFKPVLIIAKGNEAALWVQKEHPEIPLVASGVIHQFDPELFSKIPGVSLDFSVKSYFDFIRDLKLLNPKVGMIIGADQPKELKSQIEAQASEAKVQAEVVVIKKSKDVSKAIKNIYEEGANVFLMTYNPLIMNPQAFKYIIEFTIARNMVLITPSSALVKGGGMASLEANYHDIGLRTAEIANSILKDPSLADRLGLEFPSKEEVSVNQKIASSIQISIPSAILEKATHIYD